jgi:DNA-directed RNA polymerase subunit RPC12/RpoP
MIAQHTRIEPAFRCTSCGALHNEGEVQTDFGRCPVCGSDDLMPDGVITVTYSATRFDDLGLPTDFALTARNRPLFADAAGLNRVAA